MEKYLKGPDRLHVQWNLGESSTLGATRVPGELFFEGVFVHFRAVLASILQRNEGLANS